MLIRASSLCRLAPARLALAGPAKHRRSQETPEVSLRQAIVNPETASFSFTDAAATQQLVVEASQGEASASPDQLNVGLSDPNTARYPGHAESGIKLDQLIVGPGRIRQASTQHTPGCELARLILYLLNDALMRRAFRATDRGLVSGWMDSQEASFSPSRRRPGRRRRPRLCRETQLKAQHIEGARCAKEKNNDIEGDRDVLHSRPPSSSVFVFIKRLLLADGRFPART